MSDLRERLKISTHRVDEINDFLLNPNNTLISGLIEIVEKFIGKLFCNFEMAIF